MSLVVVDDFDLYYSRKSLLDCGQEHLFAAREKLFSYLPLCGMPPQKNKDIFVVMNFSVIFICKFFEMCAILFPSSTSWHTKANISVENKPSLSFTLFCCFSAFKKS